MRVICVSAVMAAFAAIAPAPEVPLKCGGPGYKATFSPAAARIPPMVDVTFRGQRPSSAVAESALRRCVVEAVQTKFISEELMATAWFGTSKNNDEPVPMHDRSDHLSYDPKTKQVRTWYERSGIKPILTDAVGYFVEYVEQPILVKPGGKFATISVVFATAPTEKKAYETVIGEVLKTVKQTKGSMATNGYALTGSKSNPSSWKPVKASTGRSVTARFDPKQPGRLTDARGTDLGVAVPSVK